MRQVFIAFLLLQTVANIAVSQRILGCYWGSWTSITQINVKLCTHAYFAFYTVDSNGVISTTSSGVVSSFLALKSQNPSVKLLASIGGYNAGTASFSAIAASSSLTSIFVSNCVALAQNYDGIDLDWEYPENYQKTTFVNLLAALKSALNARGKILAVAVAAGSWRISESYDISNVCRNVDLLNLMSYDLQWPYTETGPNAGYSVVDTSAATWINGGCPSSKVVLGLASYGYNFALTSSNNGIRASASGATALTYRAICNKLKSFGWTTVRYDQTPYSYNGNEWISYDDTTSLLAKLNIVSARNLAGAFFWSTEQDDYDNSCGMGNYPLITAVSKALGVTSGGSTIIQTTTQAQAATTKASLTTTKATLTTSSTIKCTSDGFFAYPGDCNKYYRCASGTVYIFSCPIGLGWNQIGLYCDWKQNIPGCY